MWTTRRTGFNHRCNPAVASVSWSQFANAKPLLRVSLFKEQFLIIKSINVGWTLIKLNLITLRRIVSAFCVLLETKCFVSHFVLLLKSFSFQLRTFQLLEPPVRWHSQWTSSNTTSNWQRLSSGVTTCCKFTTGSRSNTGSTPPGCMWLTQR